MTVLRCFEITKGESLPQRATPLPNAIVLESDGVALAVYDDVPLLWFPTLAELLRRYFLDEHDLVELPADCYRAAVDRSHALPAPPRKRAKRS